MRIIRKTRSLDAVPVAPAKALRGHYAAEKDHLRPSPSLLTPVQEAEVLAFWRRYTAIDDAGWADFYLERTGVFDPRFVPHDLFYAEIDRMLNPPYRGCGLDDKLLYDRLFPGVKQPEKLVWKAGGSLWMGDWTPIGEKTALDICAEAGEVVCKIPIFACGGHGVTVLDARTEVQAIQELLRGRDEVLVQAVVRQHPDMAVFHAGSVNTLRIISYLRENGEAVNLSTVLRMGAGKSRVDNISSGGCSCGVLPDGTLREVGCSSDNRVISAHPDGPVFAERRVPSYGRAVSAVLSLHRTLPQFALLAWDIAVDEGGDPVMIEVNLGGASIDFMQIDNGPLFGDYTEEVLERVYRLPLTGG